MEIEKWFGIERKDIEWFPTINYDKCTSCRACLKKCKKGVFIEESKKQWRGLLWI